MDFNFVLMQVQHYLAELATQLRDESGGGGGGGGAARRAAGPLMGGATATATATAAAVGVESDMVETVAAVGVAGSERLARHAVSTAAAHARDMLWHLGRGRWGAARGVAEAAVGELALSAESMASVTDVVRRCASGLVRGNGVFPRVTLLFFQSHQRCS